MLENGAQCCSSKIDWRLFISPFFVKAVCILLVSFTLSHFHKSTPTLLQVFQPFGWRCVECAIHHEQDVREEQHPHMWREQAIIERAACVLYCWLLPQCEALHTNHWGFLIATKWCCDQDAVMIGEVYNFLLRLHSCFG